MRCKSCDYPLWNLHARQCPECGMPFAPSEFEFAANSVAYCCPHCDQTYYGTDERGHLDPSAFDCVSCGKHIHIDEMVLRPTEGVRERDTSTGEMPWFDRKERGRVKAWFATVWLAMIYPARLMRGVPEQSPIGAAWWYAILTTLILTCGRMLPVLCFLPLLFAGVGRNAGPGAGLGTGGLLAIAGGSTVGIAVVTLVGLLVSLGLWGLICHAVLAVGGQKAGGLGRTFQALCYSSGANAITIVPCIGDFSFIWWIVSAVFMVREGQRVSGIRAAIAVLAFPLLGLVLVVALYAAILGLAIGSATPPTPTVNLSTERAEVTTLAQRITTYAADRDGAAPGHALALVPESLSGTGVFISASSATSPDDVPVNDGTLRDFQRLGPNRQVEAAQQAAAALPSGVVAHRVGDFVFTWHGIDLGAPDPGLWLVVASPDRGANPDVDSGAPSVAALADGTTQIIFAGKMSPMLERQNELRAGLGLAPLPDPASVTHVRPAVGGE